MYYRTDSPHCFTLTITIQSLADRDMFMRFRGGAVGHVDTWEINQQLNEAGWGTSWPSLKDRDPEPDVQDVADGRKGQDNGANEVDLDEGSDDSDWYDENLKNVVDGEGEDKERPMPDDEDDDGSMDEDIHLAPTDDINSNEGVRGGLIAQGHMG